MSLESLCVFLVVRQTDEDGNTGNVHIRCQNGVVGGTVRTDKIEEGEHDYNWLPFMYQGGVLNHTGDNITAGLGLANDPLSLRYAIEMTQTVNRENNNESRPMTVEAVVMLMNDDYSPNRVLSRETWVAAGMAYTASELEIVLSSAIDAVNALAPNYSLDRINVGQLPVSGQVNL